jgi:hypothetical protein
MPLVVGAAIVLFARTGQMSQALRSRTRAVESVLLKRRLGMVWLGLTVLAAYRAIVFLMAPNAAPMADCLYVNAFLVPALLVAADAVLLSWVVVEMGRAVSYRFEWQPDDSVALVRLLPNAAVTCLLLNAGRYFLVFCAIWQAQFSTPNWPAPRWSVILSICTAAQLFGLAWIGLPAILALHLRGNLRSLLAKYLELLRRAGGQILGLTLLSVAATFLAVLPFYWIFGEMQAETWSLLGAASYGHYMTLLVGIIILATLVQLANQEPGVIEPDELRAVSIPIPLGSPALHQPEAPQ